MTSNCSLFLLISVFSLLNASGLFVIVDITYGYIQDIANPSRSDWHMAHITFCIFAALAAAQSPAPKVVNWSNGKSYGPDGPWQVLDPSMFFQEPIPEQSHCQAITVGVGTDQHGQTLSTVDLYPAGFGESMIRASDYCGGGGSVCPAASAGLYDYTNSTTIIQNVTSHPATVWEWGSSSALNQTGIANEVVDTMRLNTLSSTLSVPNSTISLVHQEFFQMPDGQSYSPQVGILSLGITGGTKPLDNVTGQTFPGYLAAKNVTPSNSFGLTYGSASLNLPGSLVWGGYDQSRVVGDVGSFSLFEPGDLMVPSLLDVQIGVENGSSPFPADNYTNLLQFNQSIGSFQPTILNAIVPYLFMSPETCANIAQHLPVTLQPGLGLYTWNTDDPQYQRIVNSPAYLAFVFQSSSGTTTPSTSSSVDSQGGAANLTIKIPFALLNLTLTTPIVPNRQQYLPIQPFHSSDGKGNYYFGRAFLQAAFVGINWEQKTYFLAQAPGPGASPTNIQAISSNDTALHSEPESKFSESWAGHWTPLSAQDKPAVTPSSSTPSTSHHHLSGGAIAGITIGCMIGVFLLLFCAWFVISRRKRSAARQSKQESIDDRRPMTARGAGGLHEKEADNPRYEAGGDKGLPHEAPADKQLPEIPAGERQVYEI